MLTMTDEPKPKGKPGRKPSGRDVVQTQIKSGPGWKAWLGAYAESQGIDVSALIDRAVAADAREHGHKVMPPKRQE